MQAETEEPITPPHHSVISADEQPGTARIAEHMIDQHDRIRERWNLSENGALLTYRRLARILAISESTLRKYVSRRIIPYLKIGRCVRFDPHEIDRWLATRSHPGVLSPGQRNE